MPEQRELFFRRAVNIPRPLGLQSLDNSLRYRLGITSHSRRCIRGILANLIGTWTLRRAPSQHKHAHGDDDNPFHPDLGTGRRQLDV